MVSELSVWLLSSNKVSKKSHMASNLLESVSDLLESVPESDLLESVSELSEWPLTYQKVPPNSQIGPWPIRKCQYLVLCLFEFIYLLLRWFKIYWTWCYWVGCHRWLIIPNQVTSLWHRFGYMTPWFSLCALCKGGHVVPLQFSKGIVQTLF